MNRAVLTVGLLTLGAPAAAEPIALVGAQIRPATGPDLSRGTILLEGERIVAVGPDVAVPEGARVVDVTGRVVTPGLVAADTQVGLLEVGLEPSSNDSQPSLEDPIRAAVRADDAFDLRSTLVGVARRQGVTSVVSAPGGGLVSGRAGWFDLLDADDPDAARALEDVVSLHVRLGEAGALAVAGSRAAALSRLREYLDDVQSYRLGKAAFRRRGLYPLSAGRLDLEAGIPAVQGRMPVVIEVHRASDIRAALRVAETQKLRPVLLGASEGWLVAGELAAARVPVIVDPMENLPGRFEARNARSDNAALLARAGVPVILAVRSSHRAGNLRFGVGNAIRAGFPEAIALRSVTALPAETFGLGRTLGKLEPGARANLVVWTGDPFEPRSHAEAVYVRGRPQPVASRQTRLARRYLEQLELPVEE